MRNTEKPLFEGAWSKIKRANHHIQDLVRLIGDFSKPDRYRLTVESDAETARPVLVFEIVDPEVIDDIPLIVGDAVHNLRSALDHVVCELITRSGGTSTSRTSFTTGKTRQEAVTSIDREVQGIGLDMITSILEYVQPYGGGDGEPLYALLRLDITDKHRLIVPIFTVAGITFKQTREGQQVNTIAFSITRRKKTSVIQVAPGAKIDGCAHPVLQVLFDKVERVEGESVIPTLFRLRQSVSWTLQEVERAFLDINMGRVRP